MSESGESSDDATRLAEALRQSVSAFVRAVRQRTGTEKSAQSETLDLLESFGPMNVAALAGRRGVTHQTMRLVVAGLEADGLVQQLANTADRRSRLVSITSEGQFARDCQEFCAGGHRMECGSAWKRDPGSGVIGVEKGPLIPVV
jgi:hypothetical protein